MCVCCGDATFRLLTFSHVAQVWGVAFVVIMVLWFWLSAGAPAAKHHSNLLTNDAKPLNVSSDAELNLALLLLEKRVLALAARDTDQKVAPLASHVEQLQKAVAGAATAAHVDGLASRIVALEGLVQGFDGAHKQHVKTVEEIEGTQVHV